MKAIPWGQIFLYAMLAVFSITIIVCVWYYFVIYVPVVKHLEKNQVYFDSIYAEYQKHDLRQSTTVQQILNNF